MIEIITKDITTVETGVVAHGVNCQLRMGSGVALAIKNKWPVIYENYMNSPHGHGMLGNAVILDIDPEKSDLFVANCYTQTFYGYNGKRYANLKAIEQSLTEVFALAADKKLDVYLPKIGSGLGGLDWDTEVRPLIEQIYTAYEEEITIYICEWE